MGRIGHYDKQQDVHVCEACQKTFKSSQGLFKHYDTVHEVTLQHNQLFVIKDKVLRFQGKRMNRDGFMELIVD